MPPIADESARIGIDISEVELSHSFPEATGAADRRREGIVAVTDLADMANVAACVLRVNIDQAKGYLPRRVETTKRKASGDAFHKAMTPAFATAGVERLNM